MMAEIKDGCLENFCNWGLWQSGWRERGSGERGGKRERKREQEIKMSPYVPQQGGGCSGFVGQLPPATLKSWTLFHGFNTERAFAPQ